MKIGKVTLAVAVAGFVLSSSACAAGGSATGSATETASSSPTPTQPPADGGTYGSVEELRDAYLAAGGSCDGWSQNNRITLASESADCDTDAVLSIYLSKGDIAQLVQNNKKLNGELNSTDKSVWLTGENWVINDAGAGALKEKLGGTLVSF